MKTKYVIGFSAAALLILILSQYFIITETYKTKNEQIHGKYIGVIKEGLFEFEDLFYGFSLDSLFNAMDHKALQYLISHKGYDSIPSDFERQLNNYNDLDHYLKIYLKQSGLDPGFHSAFLVRSFTLIDLTGDNTVFLDTLMQVPTGIRDPVGVSSFSVERNYFRMTYDYFISIDHKTGIIVREMKLTLLFALFSIMMVFSVFYLTLRNMLLQKRLSDLKTDFINNMTHELKTPLSTISVASSSLINPDLTINRERIKELSLLIKKQNKHLSDLIDRILDISIWEKDQVKLQKKRVDIEKFVREVVEGFNLDSNGDATEIILDLNIHNKYVEIDEIHLTTVLNNLLLNAQKYAGEESRIEVHISSNSNLLIAVSDNGPGIGPEEQKLVFEKFYRGSESKSRATKGLGLGLYYVKQIVHAHDGEITLKSEPGKGATFEIKIPMNHEHTIG